MHNKDVIADFLNREPASTKNLSTDGTKLYSYSTCIAQWNYNTIIVNPTYYSNTTSHHLGILKRAINSNYTETITSVPVDTKDLTKYV